MLKLKNFTLSQQKKKFCARFYWMKNQHRHREKALPENGRNSNEKRKSQKSADTPQQEEPRCKDIRNFFTHTRNVKSKSNQGQRKNIIEID